MIEIVLSKSTNNIHSANRLLSMYYVQSTMGNTSEYKIVRVFKKLIGELEKYTQYVGTGSLE